MGLLRVPAVELAVLVPLRLEAHLREVRPTRVSESGGRGGKSVKTNRRTSDTVTKREPTGGENKRTRHVSESVTGKPIPPPTHLWCAQRTPVPCRWHTPSVHLAHPPFVLA